MESEQRWRSAPGILPLERADDAVSAGAKASSLARARAAGLPTLPGFVITPPAAEVVSRGTTGRLLDEVRRTWAELSHEGRRPLVVRSSSTVEDGARSSMAGRFTSVLDVSGWPAFLDAVAAVVASRSRVDGDGGAPGAMAVLVQPFIRPEAGGVLFGVDPVSGRHDRLLVAAVEGGPHELVSGAVDGVQVAMSRRGRVVEGRASIPPLTTRAGRAALAATAREVENLYGAPQDVEWAWHEGRLILLQSRPVTTLADGDARGPVFGPGPVAETFPQPLAPLEQELWVDPLRAAIREVVSLTGGASRRQLRRSPVVVAPGGRVAVDLELLGLHRRTGRVRAAIDPRPGVRRLRVAWRVGRLRASLPALALDLVERIDAHLAGVPPVSALSERELLSVLDRSRGALLSLHGYEVLVGQLLSRDAAPVTATGTALRTLHRTAREGLTDAELIARHPVLLALSPPRIGAVAPLPAPSADQAPPAAGSADVAPDDAALAREALRLRARWVQELSARAAWELGRRLTAAGRLATADEVRRLSRSEMRSLLAPSHVAVPVEGRSAVRSDKIAPLPARFRLSDDGQVVPLPGGTHGEARGAGGGRAAGVVVAPDHLPAPCAVLVVRTLDPELAPLLPGLHALVAETGSPLSHLAILARELGVATAVGVADALRRFPPGTQVVVDGATGDVCVTAQEEVGR